MSLPDSQQPPARVVGLRDITTGCLAMIIVAAGLTVASGLVVSILIYAMLMQFQAPGCEVRKELARAASPDGKWVASVYDSSWTDGGFVTTFTDTVEITRPDEKVSPCPSAGTVFAMDGVDADDPIVVTWTGPRNLEVTIPNKAEVDTQKTAFSDVRISYKYVPDDPVERACWAKWRALPSEEWIRLTMGPDAVEKSNMFFARCRAEAGTR
jgi:hypothetical protein